MDQAASRACINLEYLLQLLIDTLVTARPSFILYSQSSKTAHATVQL